MIWRDTNMTCANILLMFFWSSSKISYRNISYPSVGVMRENAWKHSNFRGSGWQYQQRQEEVCDALPRDSWPWLRRFGEEEFSKTSPDFLWAKKGVWWLDDPFIIQISININNKFEKINGTFMFMFSLLQKIFQQPNDFRIFVLSLQTLTALQAETK